MFGVGDAMTTTDGGTGGPSGVDGVHDGDVVGNVKRLRLELLQ